MRFIAITIIFFCCIGLGYALPELPEPKKEGEKPPATSDRSDRAIISGKVVWPKHDVSNATVQAFKDPNLKKLYTTGILLKGEGEYAISIEPGAYYIAAYVDNNKNGIFDTGDGMGIYGVLQWDNPKQQNRPINVQKGDKLKGIDIKISARMLETGKNKRMMPIKDESTEKSGSDPAEFAFELARLANGISGKVMPPASDRRFENITVFAYTDLTWKTRIGQAQVDSDGRYKLYLSPGKYYLLAVIDENLSDFFDPGDKFGVYGLTNLKQGREFPKAVLVEPGKIVEPVDIPIIGLQNAQGKILNIIDSESASESESESELKTGASLNLSAKISGKVKWEGHEGQELAGGLIQVYDEPSLTRPVGRTVVDRNGYFDLRLKPGEYYVIANIDADKNGKYNSGDGIGGYGSDDISGQPPVKLKLVEGDNPQIEIPITASYNNSGQLQPTAQASQASQNQAPDKEISSGISGWIYWDGWDGHQLELENVFLLVSKSPTFDRVDTYLLKLEPDGFYKTALEEGDYYLMAVADSNGDEKAASGDGVGVYGTNAPMVNLPQPISVFKGQITEHTDMYIRALYTDDQGNVAQISNASRYEIRQQYGEPEDIYRNTEFGRQVEEWWYWTKGISFKFETDGIGWMLKETNKFKPSQKAKELIEKAKSAQDQIGLDGLNGMIYYAFDKVVWSMAPNGLGFPLALGSQPSASSDRSRMAFLDLDGNVRVLEFDGDVRAIAGDPNGKIIIKRSEEATAPVISPDGRYIAFIQKFESSSKICLKHIATGEKRVLPTPDVEPQTLNWLSNGQMLVYAAAPKDNGNKRRIYSYDLVDDRIDPITSGNGNSDDSEPIWSPTDPNTFAYVRQSGGRAQIWAVTIPKGSQPIEKQVTKYGGRSPAWISDGSGIVYENNAQLWVVRLKLNVADYDAEDSVVFSEEKPILVDGKPVFGLTPFVR